MIKNIVLDVGGVIFNDEKEITFMLLEQLEQRNIRRLLPALVEFLKNPKKERIFKTIIIESLASQNVNQVFEVKDIDSSFTVNPSECKPVMELESISGTDIHYWYGTKEAFVANPQTRHLKTLHPDTKIEIFKGMNHGQLLIDRPEEVAARITKMQFGRDIISNYSIVS